MTDATTGRDAPADINAGQFRELGYALVEHIARFIEGLPEQTVTQALPPAAVRELFGTGGVPLEGSDPATLLSDAADLLCRYSLHNGHPAFLGYITSSAAPLGALADLLADLLAARVSEPFPGGYLPLSSGGKLINAGNHSSTASSGLLTTVAVLPMV